VKYKILVVSLITLITVGSMPMKKAHAQENKANNIEIYYFYHQPFGMTCSKIENYVKELTDKELQGVKFEKIDVNQTAPESIVKGYNSKSKDLVIYNRSKGDYLVSSMRMLLKLGYKRDYVKEKFIEEAKTLK